MTAGTMSPAKNPADAGFFVTVLPSLPESPMPRIVRKLIPPLLLLACAAPAAAAERLGQGPLYVRSQNPGQSFRLTSLPHDARGLPEGMVSIGAMDAVTNIWGQSDSYDYLLDFHMNDAGLFFAHGTTPAITLGLGLTERRILDAGLDQLVLEFHELVGISDNGRNEVPKNDLRIRLGRYGIDLRKDQLNNQLISRSAEGFLLWTWRDGGGSGISAGTFLHLRHELSEEALVSEDATDGALGLAFTLPRGSEVFYANLSWTRLGNTDASLIPIRENLYSGMLSWEHRFSPASSFYLQYLLDTQIFADELGDLSQPANQLQFGWKWRQRNNLTWQLAIVENFIRFSNSPDISISLGLRYNVPSSSP